MRFSLLGDLTINLPATNSKKDLILLVYYDSISTSIYGYSQAIYISILLWENVNKSQKDLENHKKLSCVCELVWLD